MAKDGEKPDPDTDPAGDDVNPKPPDPNAK